MAQLLAEMRGVRNRSRLPHYTVGLILTWIDAHVERDGCWPKATSGPIKGVPGETWGAVQAALVHGNRNLPGGTSLSKLLARKRGVRKACYLPPLSASLVLRWIDSFKRRTRQWPTRNSGPIAESALGETWASVNDALVLHRRRLHGYGSLARFLSHHRGVRNRKNLPHLKIKQILAWADAYIKRHGKRPTHLSGPIPESRGETWAAVHAALSHGNRGFPGGSSLYRFLVKYGRIRGAIRPNRKIKLTQTNGRLSNVGHRVRDRQTRS